MKLVVQTGQQAGHVFELTQDSVTIGRDARCDVALSDIAASRNHSRLQRGPNGWVIQDLGSTNGTFVNGQRIAGTQPVRVGDVIGIGKTKLCLEESTAAPVQSSWSSGVGEASEPLPSVPMATRANNTPWLVAGGCLILILLAGIGAVVMMLVQPIPTPPLSPIPSATATFTATPSPVAPTVTAVATATPITGTPGTTRNIEYTPTPTPTNTPTFTPTPTNTPTRFFPELLVLRPADKAKFTANDAIILQWQAADNLRPMDQYYIQVSRDHSIENNLVCAIHTRDTQVRLPHPDCAGNLVFNAVYYWRVQIIAPSTDGKYVPVTTGSTIRQFGWQP